MLEPLLLKAIFKQVRCSLRWRALNMPPRIKHPSIKHAYCCAYLPQCCHGSVSQCLSTSANSWLVCAAGWRELHPAG